jgi:hypothetical protein
MPLDGCDCEECQEQRILYQQKQEALLRAGPKVAVNDVRVKSCSGVIKWYNRNFGYGFIA